MIQWRAIRHIVSKVAQTQVMTKHDLIKHLSSQPDIIPIFNLQPQQIKKIESMRKMTIALNAPMLTTTNIFMFYLRNKEQTNTWQIMMGLLIASDLFFVCSTYISLNILSNAVTQIQYDKLNNKLIITYSTLFKKNDTDIVAPSDLANYKPNFMNMMCQYQRVSDKKKYCTRISNKWVNKQLLDSLVHYKI